MAAAAGAKAAGAEVGGPRAAASESAGPMREKLPDKPLMTASEEAEEVEATGTDTMQKIQWQWEHHDGSFRNFTHKENDRIEQHYRDGFWIVRMKAGVGKTMRTREIYFMDMIQHSPSSGHVRKIKRMPAASLFFRSRRWVMSLLQSFFSGDEDWWKPRNFDYFEKRRKLFNLDVSEEEEVYNSSRCFTIVESWSFTTFSMLMIVFNTFYIWADADYNDGTTWLDTDAGFIVFDNIFAVWFTVEVVIRWLAFKTWKSACSDQWFVLDTILVSLMILETWVMNLVVYLFAENANTRELSQFTILRGVRLLRLVRIARLFKVFPQLFILMKGMYLAMKSLFYTVLLLFVLTFICAVCFKNFSDLNDGMKELNFDTVPNSCWNLLIFGTFLDAVGEMLFNLRDLNVIYALCFLAFVFVSSLTLLNMLIGVVCEVIARVSENEESANAQYELANGITEIFEIFDMEGDSLLKKEEFNALMDNPDLKWLLHTHDVDHTELLKLEHVLFQKQVLEDGTTVHNSIKFSRFLDKVLQLRGGTNATVGDIVELRHFVSTEVTRLNSQCERVAATVGAVAAAAGLASGESPSAAVTPAPNSMFPKLMTHAIEDKGRASLTVPRSPAGFTNFEKAVLAQVGMIRETQQTMQIEVAALKEQLQELQDDPLSAAAF
mmetsp:Transcript_74495/g.216019  ORF Transcript_74495/g.216019 Transcript_74495/m.216019 type:complete len:663 (-) Transcript_74495:115-2103(-)